MTRRFSITHDMLLTLLLLCLLVSSGESRCPADKLRTNASRVLVNLIDNGKYGCSAIKDDHVASRDVILQTEAFKWALRTRLALRTEKIDIDGVTVDKCLLKDDFDAITKECFVKGETSALISGKVSQTMAAYSSKSKTILLLFDQDTSLNNIRKKQQTFVFRNVPDYTEQFDTLLGVIADLGWPNVQVLLGEDSLFDSTTFDQFQQMGRKRKVCIVQVLKMTQKVTQNVARNVYQTLNDYPETRAVILLTNHRDTTTFLNYSFRQTSKYVWMVNSFANYNISNINQVSGGLLQLKVLATDPTDVTDFQGSVQRLKPDGSNPTFDAFWQRYFGCSLNVSSACATNHKIKLTGLENEELLTRMAYLIRAVDQIIEVVSVSENLQPTRQDMMKVKIHDVKQFNENQGVAHPKLGIYNYQVDPLCKEGCSRIVGETGPAGLNLEKERIQIYDAKYYPVNLDRSVNSTCRTNCSCSPGRLKIDLKSSYAVFRYWDSMRPTSKTTLNPSSSSWETSTTKGRPIEVIGGEKEWYFVESAHSLVLLALAGVGFILTVVCEFFVCAATFQTYPGHYGACVWLLHIKVLALFYGYLMLVPYVFEANSATCALIRFGAGTSLAILLSCICVRMIVISRMSKTPFFIQALLLVFLVVCQFTIDIPLLAHRSTDPVLVDGKKQCRNDLGDFLLTLIYDFFLIFVIIVISAYALCKRHTITAMVFVLSLLLATKWTIWIVIMAIRATPLTDISTAYVIFTSITLILLFTLFGTAHQLYQSRRHGAPRDIKKSTSIIRRPTKEKKPYWPIDAYGVEERGIDGSQYPRRENSKEESKSYKSMSMIDLTKDGKSGKKLRKLYKVADNLYTVPVRDNRATMYVMSSASSQESQEKDKRWKSMTDVTKPPDSVNYNNINGLRRSEMNRFVRPMRVPAEAEETMKDEHHLTLNRSSSESQRYLNEGSQWF